MKRKLSFILIFILGFFVYGNVYAKNNTYYINLEDHSVKENSGNKEKIKEYSTLEDFLVDYQSDSLPDVYITKFLFDGVSSVKCPDLDDFIEEQSNDTKIKTLEIDVLNINGIGEYELTGEVKGMMVAVNTNNLKGNIDIVLNNVNIDTDSKKAPAIYVYNKDTTCTDTIVTIKTKEGTNNYIEGGKLKKVSLIPLDDLESYTSYYSGEALTNYQNYSSYYGIYTSEQIESILFATVKADEEDLRDGDPYVFYKGSGAISSDIDLYFEGEGFLKVTSKNKEGIETKGNLTFSGGTGDYEVYAYDDCLNTTTAKSAGNNVRNTMVIDVNSLLAVVNDEGDEGDAIDSNGSLTINGGKIYAFANSNSQDSGLDSEDGIVINGGTIISTGNMADSVSKDSKQKYIYLSLNQQVEADSLVVIEDQDANIIAALKSEKSYSTILYSDADIDYDSLQIYSGGIIDGEETNGLYTQVNSYQGGTEINFNEISSNEMYFNFNPNQYYKEENKDSFILKLLIGECMALALVGIYVLIDSKVKKKL